MRSGSYPPSMSLQRASSMLATACPRSSPRIRAPQPSYRLRPSGVREITISQIRIRVPLRLCECADVILRRSASTQRLGSPRTSGTAGSCSRERRAKSGRDRERCLLQPFACLEGERACARQLLAIEYASTGQGVSCQSLDVIKATITTRASTREWGRCTRSVGSARSRTWAVQLHISSRRVS
jgi:hypothetical protein